MSITKASSIPCPFGNAASIALHMSSSGLKSLSTALCPFSTRGMILIIRSGESKFLPNELPYFRTMQSLTSSTKSSSRTWTRVADAPGRFTHSFRCSMPGCSGAADEEKDSCCWSPFSAAEVSPCNNACMMCAFALSTKLCFLSCPASNRCALVANLSDGGRSVCWSRSGGLSTSSCEVGRLERGVGLSRISFGGSMVCSGSVGRV